MDGGGGNIVNSIRRVIIAEMYKSLTAHLVCVYVDLFNVYCYYIVIIGYESRYYNFFLKKIVSRFRWPNEEKRVKSTFWEQLLNNNKTFIVWIYIYLNICANVR